MTDDKLDFWIKKQYNVLFKGRHGVGKTARVINAFNRNNLKWKYFSASTLDPWVDFVGVPKEVKNENGTSYLELIRPKHFAEDEVEAIFLDEYNRSVSKVRNATMELIQFKSINGKKFEKLKFIWVAINPDDEDDANTSKEKYDVEELDPAQKDRFQIHVEIPYKPDLTYFRTKYGTNVGNILFDWWNDLKPEEKNNVSPRRLDYAGQIYMDGGDLRDVLYGKNINVSFLIEELQNGGFKQQMESIFAERDTVKAYNFVNNENCYTAAIKHIVASKEKLTFFFPHIPEEKKVVLIKTENNVLKHATDDIVSNSALLQRISTNDTKVSRAFAKALKDRPINLSIFEKFTFSGPALKLVKPPKMSIVDEEIPYVEFINNLNSDLTKGSAYRRNAYKSAIWAIYLTRGYGNPSPTKPLAENEVLITLALFNMIISQTTVLDEYDELPVYYGVLCKELSKFGKTQDYANFLNCSSEIIYTRKNVY
jgi:hypothetical protein